VIDLHEGILDIFLDAQALVFERLAAWYAPIVWEHRRKRDRLSRAEPIKPLPQPFTCTTCGAQYGTRQAVAIHERKAHKPAWWLKAAHE
jgi:hypothetical protein